MDIIISNSSPDPIYEQIKKQLKIQILKGTLKPGDPLPSIRRLARELCISVITTKRAYDELEREGFIDTVAGKGSFVSLQNAELLREKRLQLLEENLSRVMIEAGLLGLDTEDIKGMLDLLGGMNGNEDERGAASRDGHSQGGR